MTKALGPYLPILRCPRVALRCTHCLHESHLQTRFRLHFPILDSLDNQIPLVPQTTGTTSNVFASSFFRNCAQGDKRAVLDDISREIGGADVSSKEGAEGLTTRHRRRLLLHLEEKELAMRPLLPGTSHSTDAVRKHTLSIGSKWGQTPSHEDWPLWNAPSQHEFSTHFNALSMPRSLLPTVRVAFSFLSRMFVVFAFWTIKILSPVLGCLHFPKGFRFLHFIWLLDTGRLAHFFVVLAQILPVFPFSTFVDRLAKGMPISVYQWRFHPSCAM